MLGFDVIAHRGGWGSALENTPKNFEDALAAGVDANELDVRRTADGVLVVHHDANVGARLISRSKYADLRLPDGSPLPKFIDAVTQHAGRAHLDIELKEPGYENEVLREIDAGGMPSSDYIAKSFSLDAMRAIKRLRPEVRTGLIVSASRTGGLQGISQAAKAGLDFISPDSALVNETFLNAATGVGLGVFPWTPWAKTDDVRSWLLLFDPRVSGVVINQREAAVAARDALRPRPLAPVPVPTPVI